MFRDRFVNALLVVLVVLSTVVSAVQFTPELFEQLAGAKNKVPNIPIPDYERYVLPNGMVVYVAEDKRLPIVEVKGYVKYGLLNERSEIAGISNFMLDLMNSATKNRDEIALAEEKELHGVSIVFGVKPDYYEISASALSEDLEALLDILADELRNPQFRGDNFARKKQEHLQSFAHAKTQEQNLARMYFYRVLYGEDHPYSFLYNYDLLLKTVSALTPEQVEDFHKQTITPNRIVLVIVGDFERETVRNVVERYFGDWEPTAPADITPPRVTNRPPYGEILVVDRPTSTQAYLMMGHDLFDHRFEGRIAFLMANRVYGSGMFNCRLMKVLRTQKGYVYGVSAGMQNHEVAGEYFITTSVRYDAIADTIKTVVEEMRAIKDGERPITEEELFEVVNLYNAQFPDAYRDTISILDSVAFNAEIRGRNPNYVNEFIQAYNSLTADVVNQVFSEHAHPDRLFAVIVGLKDKIVEDLERNGYKNYRVVSSGR